MGPIVVLLGGQGLGVGRCLWGPRFEHDAIAGDYAKGRRVDDPYRGYYYNVLKRQGPHQPGGAYDYLINGNMIAGFALLAWPADYASSGVMTFVVNQQGKVFQKNLGPKTAAIARAMTRYDPDASWTEVTD